jgi:Potential Queuosine, Q, salvage protein family
MSLFDCVRSACRGVAERARFVRIDHARMREYALSLAAAGVPPPSLDLRSHFLDHGDQTLAFIVILDTINFGSGWFPYLRKRPGLSGSSTIETALWDAFRAGEDFSAQRLAHISPSDCAQVLGQNPAGHPLHQLLEKFAQALNDLGCLLLELYGGSFAALVESAAGSAETLVRKLSIMPFFADVQRWHDLWVPFYKRAQLTAADLALAFDKRGWGEFHDLGELTIFADNLVPHVLRIDKVLVYDEHLARQIDAEELIPPGQTRKSRSEHVRSTR